MNWPLIISLVFLVAGVLGLLSCVHAIMSTRTSQGTIAWVVSLVSFPLVAVPAYWVFGRNKFRGYVTARSAGNERERALIDRAIDGVERFIVRRVDESGAVRAAEGLAMLPIARGNSVELLIDGTATFDSICAGIDAATTTALVQFFIVKDDGLGRRLRDVMIAASGRGVRVRFIYDEVGSKKLPRSYIEALREAGVEAREFDAAKGRGNRFQFNFRNHRKVVVVDGRVAWIGGHNVGDEYLGLSPRFGHWRDTHVRIEGPAALAAQLSFVEDWHWSSGTVPELDWTAHGAADGSDSAVLIVPSGPADALETASLMFVHAINSARERIWIASPYFVPDEAVMSALQLAGLRGVDVRILIPDEPDHLLVYLAAFSYLDEAGSTGVTFHRYRDGFLHAKSMLIDDAVAGIGTANFDNRSFRLNFEITALVIDEEFAAEVERMFLDDFAHARQMEPREFDAKPYWFRFAVRAARLTAPVL